MKSINYTLETSIVGALGALDTGVPVVGLLQDAAAGTVKEEDLTALHVRVYGVQQPHESMPMYQTTAEVRLNVEQASSADGSLFLGAHEAVALWMQHVMLADNCTELSTEDVFVDGLQMQGGDADYEISGGVWYAVWNMTLTGRLKTTTQEES